MVDIKNYYLNNFRSDIFQFMGDPQIPYFGHSWRFDCRNLERIERGMRPQFLICLYFTVLVDQAMHCHFRAYYNRFENLTRYPKFCHGLGQFQLNPRGILSEPIRQHKVDHEILRQLLLDGMRLFVKETVDFFNRHMPEIIPQEFFGKLIYDPDVQIPMLIVILNKDVANDIEYQVYDALRNAVDEAGLRN